MPHRENIQSAQQLICIDQGSTQRLKLSITVAMFFICDDEKRRSSDAIDAASGERRLSLTDLKQTQASVSECRRVNSVYNNDNRESSAQLVVKACSAYDASLHRFLIHQLRSRQSTLLADDLAQEVYLRLLRFKDADLIRHPQAYLYQIARNVLADRLAIEGSMRERVVFDSTLIERSQEYHESTDHDSAGALSAEDRVCEYYS